MEFSHNCDCGLRELKRRRTRRGIEDAATDLVAQHGYDNVTLDDICAANDISRRTFFNYFESKEHAVFGHGIVIFTDQDEAEFSATEHTNPTEAMLLQLENNLLAVPTFDDDLPDPIARLEANRATRKDIIHKDPALITKPMSMVGPTIRRVHHALVANLERFPQSRQHQELELMQEASISTGFIRECILYTASHIEHPFQGTPLQTAARVVTSFSRSLPW